MKIFSNLYSRLYEENLTDFTFEVARGLAKIAELYWEKLPLEKRKRIVFQNYKNLLILEYLPKDYLELMEYTKKDYSNLKKRMEISLKEEAEKLLRNFHNTGNYSRFKTYIEKSLLSPEEVLLRIGFGEKIYQMLKNSIDYLLTKREEKTKQKSQTKELIRFAPLLILISLVFLFSSSTTGLVSLPYPEISPLLVLLSLAILLLLFLFFL